MDLTPKQQSMLKRLALNKLSQFKWESEEASVASSLEKLGLATSYDVVWGYYVFNLTPAGRQLAEKTP